MNERILVINPNSNDEVTSAIDRALLPLRSNDAPRIDCITAKDGPYGVESQRDSDAAAIQVVRLVEENLETAAAFIIACYSDPGLAGARELTDKPVLGIAETALATAIQLGGAPGVISILDVAVDRHWRYARALGLADRIVADLAVGLPVADLADEEKTRVRMLAAGRQLRDDFGATMIILGCAGMARYRGVLEDDLGMSVIDPTQAAVAAAISALRLGFGTGRQGS